MNDEQYSKIVNNYAPSSPLFTDMLKAFFAGGILCLLGEFFRSFLISADFSVTTASTWVSIMVIIIAQILSGFGIYEKAAKYAGAGFSVPISGFANSVVSPAIEYHTEGLILGLGAKLFTIAGPVIVYGITSSVAAGIIYYIGGLLK